MADTTLATIVGNWQDVLEADPLNLTKAQQAFSHDRQPNLVVADTYYIEDLGLTSSRPMSNNKAARIDQLRVSVAKKANFDGASSFVTLSTLLNTIERYIKADGLANSYHAEIASHRVTQPKGRDILIGEIAMTADYDFNEATS